MIKTAILAVNVENSFTLSANVDQMMAYNIAMLEFINHIKLALKKITTSRIINKNVPYDVDTIMQKLYVLFDENVELIFVIGYNLPNSPYKLSENDIATIMENTVDKNIQKYASLISKMKANLESKYHRVIWGVQQKTLIINLFGFYEKEALKICNIIITTLKQQTDLMIELNKQAESMLIKRHGVAELTRISVLKMNPNEKSFSSAENMSNESNISNQITEESFSLFDTMMTEANQSNQATVDDESFLVSPIISDELNVAHYVTVDYSEKSSPLSDTMTEEENSSNESIINDDTNNNNESNNESNNETNNESLNLLETNDETELKDFVPNKQFPIIDLTNALSIMCNVIELNIYERQYEMINVNDAYGRILCQTIHSDCAVPAFRVSTKHGFAVLQSDNQGIRKILKENNTGTPVSLQPGTCVWVNSGARIPNEATAVVPVKDTKQVIKNNNVMENLIMINLQPKFGQNIKNVGSDIREYELLIKAFTRIGPSELGLLVASGHKKVYVTERVIVGVLSIGNFLEEPGNSLRDGYVYDSNRISVIALLKENGFDSILDCGIVADNILHTTVKIKEVLEKVDVLVTIGCSNDNDHLKRILTDSFEANIHFGNVNIKPGKSTTFATIIFDDKIKYFLCLPKNPVSTLITARLFLIPLMNGLHHIPVKTTPCTTPVCINERFILHSRPRLSWVTLKWQEENNFARACSKGNLVRDKPCSSQSANALIMLPQKTDLPLEHPSFVNALMTNISNC